MLSVALICWPEIVLSHGGETPEQVMIGMKHKGTGPFASPMFRDNRGLANDWLDMVSEDYQKDGTSGIIVTSVKFKGLAEKSGIKAGDLITAVNEQSISSVADLNDFMSKIKSQKDLEFSLRRDGDRENAIIRLNTTLEEIDPKLAGVMRGEFQPTPGMMRNSMQEVMFAQAPTSNLKAADNKRQPSPGMFAKDMMEKLAFPQLDQINIRREETLANYFKRKLAEKQRSEGISEEKRASLRQINVEYKKFMIKNKADRQLSQIDLQEALAPEEADLDQAAEAAEKINKLKREKTRKLLDLIKELLKK